MRRCGDCGGRRRGPRRSGSLRPRAGNVGRPRGRADCREPVRAAARSRSASRWSILRNHQGQADSESWVPRPRLCVGVRSRWMCEARPRRAWAWHPSHPSGVYGATRFECPQSTDVSRRVGRRDDGGGGGFGRGRAAALDGKALDRHHARSGDEPALSQAGHDGVGLREGEPRRRHEAVRRRGGPRGERAGRTHPLFLRGPRAGAARRRLAQGARRGRAQAGQPHVRPRQRAG